MSAWDVLAVGTMTAEEAKEAHAIIQAGAESLNNARLQQFINRSVPLQGRLTLSHP